MGDYRIYLLDKANRIGPWWLWGGDDTRHCTSGASDQGTDPGPLPASDGAADCGTAACADQGAPGRALTGIKRVGAARHRKHEAKNASAAQR